MKVIVDLPWSGSLLFLALSMGLAPLSQSGQLTLDYQARSLQPGEVVLLRVSAPASLSKISGEAFGKTLSFFEANPGEWLALAGIDLAAAPGKHSVNIEADFPSGSKPLQTAIDLDVQPKKFPTRRLTVDSKYVDPPVETQQRIQRESRILGRIFRTVSAERLWEGAFRRPVPGRANSSFGKRSILNGKARSPHSGTDFQAGQGTPIQSPNRAKVVLAQDLYFSGQTVILDHGQGLYSYFAHLSEFKVEKGQHVSSGDVLGLVGATGRVTGPHLHWAVRLNGALVDPLSLMAVLDKEVSRQDAKSAKN